VPTFDLAAKYFLDFNAVLTEAFGTASAQNSIPDALVPGSTNFAAIQNVLSNGTAANQATNLWHDRRSVGAGANDDLDLNNASILNAFGQALALTKVAWVFFRIVTPATTVRLVLGAAASNPWQAWFGATTHTEEVQNLFFKDNQIDQWTVSGTSKVLRVNNPTASAVIYDIVILGSP